MESEKVVADELPLAIVRRVVKDKLSECSPDYDVSIHKEALLAFSESARIFIHYLSATANDFCKDAKRQTMKADDVLKAIEEMEFSEFLEPLQASLQEFKKKTAGKKAATSRPSGVVPREAKKRKTEEGSSSMQKDEENDDAEENGHDDTEENGSGEENGHDDNEENGNDEEIEKEGEGNSVEENRNESGNEEDNSVEEIGSENGEDHEDENGDASHEEGEDD